MVVSLFSTFAASAQTPIYNSYPAAQAVILLDFDGHYVTGTDWNMSGPIDAGPSNLNNNQIAEIFSRVAEDYRPFNINVTTDEARYWAAPARQRMRVILTISHEWYGNGAGGVAFLNSFTSGNNTPCFVFTSLLRNNAKNIAEAASHEAGHTLGLRHQAAYDGCNRLSEYNSGIGTGEVAWAPIMGVGYSRNFTVWHNGPTPSGCNSFQNDLATITNSTNGFGYRPDDHGSTFRESTSATFNGNKFNVEGVISKTDDVDIFKFTMPKTGVFKLSGIPYNVGVGNVGSNLDMQLDLFDSKQQLIGTYNPGTELSSIVDTVLNAGTYYFKVDGQGNMYASDYGSLGSYSLQGTYGDFSTLPVHKLELKGLSDNGQHKLTWVIEADEAVVKQVLEVSENGSTFKPVLDAATDARSYHYIPSVSSTLQYRLNVTFDNGRQYYSNVVALRNNSANSKPSLFNTLVRNNSLMISTPYACQYTIVDFNGRQVASGSLTTGSSSVNISQLSQGTYIIRFANKQEFTVEKFVKQ